MIVAGFGFRADAGVESLKDALEQTGVSRVDVIATLADKADAPSFHSLAAQLGVKTQSVPIGLATRQDTISRSEAALEAYGVASIAEACALASAGPGARLHGPRSVSADRMATCAIAVGDGG